MPRDQRSWQSRSSGERRHRLCQSPTRRVRCSSDLASGWVAVLVRAAVLRSETRRSSCDCQLRRSSFVAAFGGCRIVETDGRQHRTLEDSPIGEGRHDGPRSWRSKKRSTDPRWRRQQQSTARPWEGQCAQSRLERLRTSADRRQVRGPSVPPVDEFGRQQEGDGKSQLSESVHTLAIGIAAELAIVREP